MRKLNTLIIAFILYFGHPTFAQAITSEFSALYFRPAVGERDFVFTHGTRQLETRQWRAFSFFHYGRQPIERTQSGNRVTGIIDHLFVQEIGGAYALTDWWQTELGLPLIWINEFTRPVTPAPSSKIKTGIGDLMFKNRFVVWDSNKHFIGISLIPFVTFPTGNEYHFASDHKSTGGFLIAIDKDLSDKFFTGINIGLEGREKTVFDDLILDSRLILSGGLAYKPTTRWAFKGDVLALSPVTRLFTNKVSTTTEAFLDISHQFKKSGFKTNVGGGLPLVQGAGVPDFRAFLGVSYTHIKNR